MDAKTEGWGYFKIAPETACMNDVLICSAAKTSYWADKSVIFFRSIIVGCFSLTVNEELLNIICKTKGNDELWGQLIMPWMRWMRW